MRRYAGTLAVLLAVALLALPAAAQDKPRQGGELTFTKAPPTAPPS